MGFLLLRNERQPPAVLNTLRIRMSLCQLIACTFHVATEVFHVLLQLLVHRVLTFVVLEVLILHLGVELPGVGFWSLHADLEAVIGNDAG